MLPIYQNYILHVTPILDNNIYFKLFYPLHQDRGHSLHPSHLVASYIVNYWTPLATTCASLGNYLDNTWATNCFFENDHNFETLCK